MVSQSVACGTRSTRKQVVMVPTMRRRTEMTLLMLLCAGGKRGCGAMAFRMRHAPLTAGLNATPVKSVCRPAVHRSVRTRALPSTVGAIAEETQGIESSSERAVTSRKTVAVSRGKARLFWEGNPLVYGGAVSRVEGDPAAGEVVDVIDSSGKFIAWGVYNPDSMYRVRVLAIEGEAAADGRDVDALVRRRLRTARDARRAIGIPNAETDTYRLVNGEGDRLSGLVVDVFSGVVGVSSSAVWVEAFRPEIEAALEQEFGADATEIIWRRSDGRLQQDGWKGNAAIALENGDVSAASRADGGFDAIDADTEGLVGQDGPEAVAEGEWGAGGVAAEGGEVQGRRVRDDVPTTVVRELGLEYEIRPQFGQKTGFYCDQRESREAVRKVSGGKNVLDMFCYSGGFALNAAAGGASRVVAVDSSQPALEEAQINAARNNLEGTTEFVKDDALKYMKTAAANGDRFDMVVLDPPKLAPNKKALTRATSRYKRLNAAALELIAPGGMLVTFTCSAAMTQSGEFVGVVQSAARAAGRTLTLLRTVGPAADHVINPCYPEGAYLTGAFFYVT